jgi:hypothetical protein
MRTPTPNCPYCTPSSLSWHALRRVVTAHTLGFLRSSHSRSRTHTHTHDRTRTVIREELDINPAEILYKVRCVLLPFKFDRSVRLALPPHTHTHTHHTHTPSRRVGAVPRSWVCLNPWMFAFPLQSGPPVQPRLLGSDGRRPHLLAAHHLGAAQRYQTTA